MPIESVKPNFLDRTISFFSPARGLRRMYAKTVMLELSAYRAASTNRLRKNWVLGESDVDAAAYDRALIVERSRDANRNDPVAKGASDTMRNNIVGTGLHPQSTLRSEVLGISDDRAAEIRRQIEYAFEVWSPQADAANIMSFDEIQFLALTKVFEDGEVLAIPTWAKEGWRDFGRCVELIEGTRLASPVRSGADVKNGIKFGDRGQPKRYFIRKKTSSLGLAVSDFNSIAARDSQGRQKILHVFRADRPGQTRGLPYFTPVLTYFKDLADYLEAEVVAARIAACLAVFITKNDPMGIAAAAAAGTDTEPGTGKRIQTIQPGMVGYLGPSEGVEVVDPKRPGDSFPSFVEAMMRIIGVSLGLPYELIAKDFSKTNYSSARASLLEGRRMFTGWRKWFARRFCQPIWEMVVEEAYLRDMLDINDFYKFKTEYCRASWIGGAWGWVDPVKEIEASRKAIDYGLSSHAEEVAGQGRDWEENFKQLKREEDFINNLGVTISRSGQNNQPMEDNDDGDAGPEKKE